MQSVPIKLVIRRRVFFFNNEFPKMYFYFLALHTLSRRECYILTMVYLLQSQLSPIIVLALVSNYTEK